MQQHKVSVLIPTYNQAQLIDETLASVVAQTYDNLEVVVTDDASTDATPEKLKQWAEKYPSKIKIFLHEQRLGITGNHTRGLSYCTGDFVVFLDGDDLLLPPKIATQVKFMLEHPQCTISYHDLEVFQSDTNKTIYRWSERYGTRQGDVRDLIRFGNFVPALGVMVRRKDLPEHGYDQRIKVYSDWLLWVETLINGGGRICYFDAVLGRYRRHATNATNYSAQKFIDAHQTLDIIEKRWPQYRQQAAYRRSEVYFMQMAHSMMEGDIRRARQYFYQSWKLGKVAWLRLLWREILFLLKSGFRADDILISYLKK